MKELYLTAAILFSIIAPSLVVVAQDKQDCPPGKVRESTGYGSYCTVGDATNVTKVQLFQRIPPAYPPLARKAGIDGDVVLDVIIGADGSVKSATALRGDPFLTQAAVDAVERWKYRPSEAEVRTQVTVNFSLENPTEQDTTTVAVVATQAPPSVVELNAQTVAHTPRIAPDKLALEASLIDKEKKTCSNQSDVDVCRSEFLEGLKYKRIRLTPSGSIGVIVELAASSDCGSGGCPFVVLKQNGSKYQNVLEEFGLGMTVEKTTTNGFYDMMKRFKDYSGPVGYSMKFEKYFWDGSKYLTEKDLQAERQQQKTAAKQQEAVALPDGEARAAARRRYASTVESVMLRNIRNNRNIDPTLVRLNVYTETPQKENDIQTRDDFRLNVETNSIVLPRDVVAFLRKQMFNSELYKLGFREVAFYDTVGVKPGTVLCAVTLKPDGAHPLYCMKMGTLRYTGGSYGPGWDDYHRWPQGYVIHDGH